MRTPFLLLLVLSSPLACSGSGATATFDAAVEDVGPVDSTLADGDAATTDSTGTDTKVADAATDTTASDSTASDTGAPTDTAKTDVGFDAAGTFECGTERCGATFQFCQIDTAPGTGRHCVPLPAACFAFPACACVTTKTCGSEAKGTCTDVSGAITVQCK